MKQDIAEFYLWMDGDGAEFGEAELPHLAVGAANAWTTNVQRQFWTDAVRLETVTATSYLANGHTLAQAVEAPPTPWAGSFDPPSLPWETAMAISLYTYPRGSFVTNQKRKRGRYYLPPLAAHWLATSNSGFFDDSSFPSFMDHQVSFLQDAGQTDVGADVGVLSVFSRTDSVLRHVSQISADAKIDSQRRRQNRETAGHREVAFP